MDAEYLAPGNSFCFAGVGMHCRPHASLQAYYREGSALQAMESWEAAAQAYFQGFRMDPQNTALAQAFQHAVHKAREEHAAAHKSS